MWILYAVLYAIFVGFYNVLRKKACEKTNLLFLLAITNTFGFFLVAFAFTEAMQVSANNLILILIKSIILSLSWVLEIIAFKNYYISSLQPISAIKVVLTFVASLIIFDENLVWWRFIGVAIIFIGLISLNQFDKKTLKNNIIQSNINNSNLNKRAINDNKIENAEKSNKFILNDIEIGNFKKKRILSIVCFSFSCLLNGISGILDKFILTDVTTNQLQFWFMLFISALFWLYFFIYCIAIKRINIKKSDWKNYLLYILPIFEVLANGFIFMSIGDENAVMSAISVLKELSTIMIVIYGAMLFKEPNLKKKLIYLAFILIGIIIVVA